MKITWIAHACFKVDLENGLKLLFDPFGDTIGYTREETEADIVLISHNHHDHNSLEHIREGYRVINKPGKYEFDGAKIEGIQTHHDNQNGKLRGENTMYRIEAEGLTLLHMGDIGHTLDAKLYERLGKIDILFIPVGGVFTIDAEEALEICKSMEPNIIIPMHYKTLFLNMKLAPVYNFTDAASGYFDRSRLGSNTFEITAANKKKRSRIIVMENSLDN